MLSYKESLKILKEANAIIEGHFILSSGLHSAQYVQCAQLLSKPLLAEKISFSLSEKINKEFNNFDLILSPAMGGIVIGYEIGRLLKKESIFCERVDGTFQLRRGFKILKNTNVLILEDVITTGKSSLECEKLVTNLGGNVIGYACIIDRTKNKSQITKKIVSQIELDIPTYRKDNLPDSLLEINAVKPGSRNI